MFMLPATRYSHKILGLIMLLPFIAWSSTAVFFLLRPGYDEAYERPTVQQYPARSAYTIPANENWLEARTPLSRASRGLTTPPRGLAA